jgi:hypothetical protein
LLCRHRWHITGTDGERPAKSTVPCQPHRTQVSGQVAAELAMRPMVATKTQVIR